MKRGRLTQIKKIIKEVTILLMIESFFLSTIISSTGAEEGLFGNGYRDYLNNKIRNGYNLDTFMGLDRGQKEKIAKRKQIEALVDSSRGANADFDMGVQKDSIEKAKNSQAFQEAMVEQRQQREKNAAATGEFQYIAYADGKKEYFTDGLVTTVENEKVTDEFGNVSRKDTRNMKYNDKRLFISYDATLTDAFGSTTKVIFDGAEYSPDSVFYASNTTRANKNLTKYHTKEIDAGGNVADRSWQGKFGSKFAAAFTQNVLDPLYGNYSFQRTDIRYENDDPERPISWQEEGIGRDGLPYTLDRISTTYDSKGNVLSYHEVKFITQVDGSKAKVTTGAQFEYLEAGDGDRILKSIITTTTENPDGSYRTETDTTAYNYDANKKLIGGSGSNSFTGQEADWYEYKDTQGHLLSRNVDKEGNVTYSYIDPDTLKTEIVDPSKVTATLKDGNLFSGTSEIQYEILYGKPMTKQANSSISYYGQNISNNELQRIEDSTIIYTNGLVNNLQRLLANHEHTEVTYPLLDPDNSHMEVRDINVTYVHDSRGNLTDAFGLGTGSGWEYQPTRGWYGQYTSTIREEYTVILGKALMTDRTDRYEEKNYLH